MRPELYSTELTDAQIASILRKRKRRKRIIRRLVVRGGILFVALVLVLSTVMTGIRHFTAKDTHATDVGPDIKGIIFLDPGHGGYETGTEYKKRVEKEDTLALGLLIRQELQKRGYQVEMSRTDDEYLSRRERATLANRSGAGLMISLHRNKGVKGQGFAAYIQSEDRKQDRILGKNIMKQIEKVGVSASNGVQPGMPYNSGRDFTENRFSNMPSALIVFGYINNKKDNQLFDQHLEEYAAAVAKGIDKTYNKLYR